MWHTLCVVLLSSSSLNHLPSLKVEVIPILHKRELRPKESKNVPKVRWLVCDVIKLMFFLPYIK